MWRASAARKLPGAIHFHQLQSLRALAALMVVMQHAQFLHHPRWWGSTVGALGVDLFFVISGFVIVTVTRNEQSFRRYALRRLIRIVPLYWLLTCVMAALVLFAPGLFRATWFTLDHFIASLLFIPTVSPSRPDEISPLLPPGWTLNFEMFFYLVFGALIALRLRGCARIVALSAVFGLLIVAGMVLQPAAAVSKYYTSWRLLEFLAGAWVGQAISRWRLNLPGWTYAGTGVLGAVLLMADETWFPLGGRIAGSALLVFAATASQLNGIALRSALIEKLGDASYSIYLSHVFTIGALKFIWLRTPFAARLPFEPVWFIVICILASALIGLLIHLWLERPMLSGLRRHFNL